MATQSKTKSWNLKEAILEAIGKGQSVINGMTKGAAQAELEVSRKNWIINGDNQVDQRDLFPVTGAVDEIYYLDRFKFDKTVVSVDLSLVTTNQPPAFGAGRSVKYVATSGGTAYFGEYQIIEDYEEFDSRTATYSAWIKSNSSDARLVIFDGTTKGISQGHSGDGNWELLSVTFNIPSGNTAVKAYAGIYSSTWATTTVTSGDYFEIRARNLEIGDTATPFESRSYAEELALCQRYYQRISQDGSTNLLPLGICYVNSTTNARTAVHFPVRMRDFPTVSFSSAADFTAYVNTTAFAATAVGNISQSKDMALLSMTISGATVGQAGYGQIEASTSGWVDFNAEL